MRRLVLVVVCASFLSGCAYFTANKKLRECDALVTDLDKQLIEATAIIDSQEVVIINLKEDLKECRALKNE